MHEPLACCQSLSQPRTSPSGTTVHHHQAPHGLSSWHAPAINCTEPRCHQPAVLSPCHRHLHSQPQATPAAHPAGTWHPLITPYHSSAAPAPAAGYSVLQGPSTSMVRPHPAVWRLVHGVLVAYTLFLVWLLFQDVSDARAFLKVRGAGGCWAGLMADECAGGMASWWARAFLRVSCWAAGLLGCWAAGLLGWLPLSSGQSQKHSCGLSACRVPSPCRMPGPCLQGIGEALRGWTMYWQCAWHRLCLHF
jgi:hypothetical protein